MYKYRAVVTKVVEGDLVKAAIDLGFGVVYQIKLKLAGINCEELKDKRNKDKILAIKKSLEDSVLGKEVTIKSLKTEKFGRYLCFIYLDGHDKSLNDELVEKGLVSSYINKGKEALKAWLYVLSVRKILVLTKII